MNTAETAFLERTVVQILFVSGREFSIESLREKLRELFVQEPDATVRSMASIGSFELLQVLLKTTQKLEKLGLRLDMRAGGVRVTTAEVRPPTLRNYFTALAEQSRAERAGVTGGHEYDEQGPLSTTGLEVLACIAFKQPLSCACSTWGSWIAASQAKPDAPCGRPRANFCDASTSSRLLTWNDCCRAILPRQLEDRVPVGQKRRWRAAPHVAPTTAPKTSVSNNARKPPAANSCQYRGASSRKG